MVGSSDVHLFTYTVVIILLVVPSVCVLYKMLKQVICITAVLLFHPPPFEMQGLCAELPKIPITCNAGAYLVGTTASVICNFNKDMNTDKRPINVVRYEKSTFLDDPGTDVLLCQWKDKGQSYECKLETGFSIDGNITDHLRLKLPADTENFTGLYICFIMHAQETLPNACELTVKGAVTPASAGNRQSTTIVEKRQSSTDANAGETGTNSYGVIAGVIVGLLVLAGVIIVIFFMRRRRNSPIKKGSADSAERMPHIDDNAEWDRLIPSDRGNEDLQETTAYPNKQLMMLLYPFLVGFEETEMLRQATQKELNAYSTPQTTSNNTFCTTVKALPKKTEWGDVLVVNLGSRHLTVVTVELRGEDIVTNGTMTYRIPADVRTGTSKRLLEFIADRVSMFLKSNKLFSKQQSVGCILSFPCKYKKDGDLTTARIAKWSKGFRCKDVVDRNWRDLLQHALKQKIVCNLEIKAVVNDLVALFMSAVREDDKCSMAVGLSNGFSACYLQQGEDQSTSGDEINCTGKVIISTECGALGEDRSLDNFRTQFDITLDQNTVNPGQQILEKMISRLYLGEIVRLVLLKLILRGMLFSQLYSAFTYFNEKGSFSTEHVALIQSDTSEDHYITKAVLHNLEVDHYDAEDCNIVKYVCRIVFQRSAFLAAAAIAALVKHVGQKEVTIAVDGSLYRIHPRYGKLLEAKTQELVGPECKVTFQVTKPGATGIGAALTAAISMSAGTDQDTPSTKTH